ncbi:NADP-dependent oxidoreductase [Microbispora sp. NPDC049125]|uniref:NADP-dependent oxidoreductase n=1 Tax=Microbispora sp. NPDC049125 TaxID=3154929 RepID=UPI003466F5FF
MRALVGRSGTVELVETPDPEPGPGQVRIKVLAAAVQPIDLFTASGGLPGYGLVQPMESYGLGWDVAGVVDRVGPAPAAPDSGDRVAAPGLGDAVIGLSDRLPQPVKAQADYVVLDATAVAPAPAGVPAVRAATLPLNTLTAIQALDLAGLREGESLLVTGAAGALGGYLVEIAAARGIRVAALAGREDEALVRGFGAEWFIPRGTDLSTAVRAAVPGGVDGVVDAALVGLPALDAVRGGGSFVAVGAGQAPLPLRGVRVSTVFIRADGAQLAAVSGLAESGRLTMRVADVYKLDEAAEAYARMGRGGLRGRLVLVP